MPNEASGEVVRNVTNNLPQDVGATMPTARAMKQIVQRARQGEGLVNAPVPITMHGWDFPGALENFDDGTNATKEDF